MLPGKSEEDDFNSVLLTDDQYPPLFFLHVSSHVLSEGTAPPKSPNDL